MADEHVEMYGWGSGSETDRQSYPLEIGNPSAGAVAAGSGVEGLGDYRSLNGILPPNPGPRAADVWSGGVPAPRFPPRQTSWPAPQPTYFGVTG